MHQDKIKKEIPILIMSANKIFRIINCPELNLLSTFSSNNLKNCQITIDLICAKQHLNNWFLFID